MASTFVGVQQKNIVSRIPPELIELILEVKLILFQFNKVEFDVS